MALRSLLLTLAVALSCVVVSVNSQINTPCTPSMINSFTPCMNLVMNSTTNSSSTPMSDCCNFLKSLTGSGTDCLCLLVTGNVPIQNIPIPINRTLAISLPRACRMPGVPVQCKAAAAAIPPAGPPSLEPAPSPDSTSPVPQTITPTSAPESDSTPDLLTPPSTSVDSGLPTSNTGSRPTLTPSAAASSYVYSPFMLGGTGATLIGFFMLF